MSLTLLTASDQEGKKSGEDGQTHIHEKNPSTLPVSASFFLKASNEEEKILVLGDYDDGSSLNIKAGGEIVVAPISPSFNPSCRGLSNTEFEFEKGMDDVFLQDDELENIDPRCINQLTNALLGKAKGSRGRRSNRQKREDAIGSVGGLGMVWNLATVEVAPIASHQNWRACEIKGIGTNFRFPIFNVYGPMKTEDKLKVWREITLQSHLVELDRVITVGDFNALLDVDEEKGGLRKCSKVIKDFRDFIEHNKLIDIILKNDKFTWTNKRLNFSKISERLDRFFAREWWLSGDMLLVTSIIPQCGSDHLPISLSIGMETHKQRG
ncbi:hypothetical protein SUGI_1004460 [Cryptomeria japonica]|nr:hypothetical protein SUGI_1004460 [Cryptomeria japonica]